MTLSNGSPLPHGIEVVSGSTMELPSTDAAIPLSASSEMYVPEPAFCKPHCLQRLTACMVATKTLDNAHGNVLGARILDNNAGALLSAAACLSSSHPYPTTAAIERFASPKTEQEIT